MPLGLGRAGRSHTRGALTGLTLAFGYYSLGAVGHFMAAGHMLSPGLALWLPNLVFGITGVVLIVRGRWIAE